MLKLVAPVTALVLALPSSAVSQESERYLLEKSENGYVRMDTRTGEMSICRERSGQLVCERAADERAAHGDEIDALHARIDALEERIAALGRDGPGKSTLPSEEEFERTLGFMERFFRRFMEIVEGFEPDSDGDVPREQPEEEPQPERT